MSANSERTQFRPNQLDVEERPLSRLRGIAGENSIYEGRMYRLAIEFAYENESSFEEFVVEREAGE